MLFCQSPSAVLIELIDDPFKKTVVGTHTVEIRRPPQFNGLLDPVFERTMSIFHGAVFMADAQVIGRWLHAVVLAQRSISLREFLFVARIDVCGIQAVGAVFPGCAAQFMQGGLQTIGQRTITFPTQDDMNSAPMAICQTKLIQLMIERLTWT